MYVVYATVNPGTSSLLTGYVPFVFQYLIRLPGDSDLGAKNTEIQYQDNPKIILPQ